MYEGSRYKSLVDVVGAYPHLTEEDSRQIDNYVTAAGVKFKRGDTIMTGVKNLMDQIPDNEVKEASNRIFPKPGEAPARGEKHWDIVSQK